MRAAAIAKGLPAGAVAPLQPGEHLLTKLQGRLAVKSAAVSDVVS